MEQVIKAISKAISLGHCPPEIEETLQKASLQIATYLTLNRYNIRSLTKQESIIKHKLVAEMIFDLCGCSELRPNYLSPLDIYPQWDDPEPISSFCNGCDNFQTLLYNGKNSTYCSRGWIDVKTQHYIFCPQKNSPFKEQRVKGLLSIYVCTRIDWICSLFEDEIYINYLSSIPAGERMRPLNRALWKGCQLELIEKLKKSFIFKTLLCNLSIQNHF